MKSNVLNIKNSDYEVTLKMIYSLTPKTFLKNIFYTPKNFSRNN